MKCPHCLVAFHESWKVTEIDRETPDQFNYIPIWTAQSHGCPTCKKTIIFLKRAELFGGSGHPLREEMFMVWPKGTARPLSPEVTDPYRKDFLEACLILVDSPKASAAISRRCLQSLLRNEARVKPSDLSKEIDEVLASKTLPTHLAEAIDGIRNIGNFAAHPLKSQNTGEIVDVEAGEAEWLLDTLEGMFDFYFVQPAILRKKRAALNNKLKDIGKPPMK